MIGTPVPLRWGQALAGLALSLCVMGCGSEGSPATSPDARDEEAALEDAAAMLEARESAESISDDEPLEPPEA